VTFTGPVDALTLVRRDEPGANVLEAGGELDLGSAARLAAAVGAAAQAARPRVVIDLSRLEFCDSTGLRALMGATREVEVRGGRLVLVAPPGSPIERLLELTGVAEFLPAVATREAALRLVTRAPRQTAP